MSFNTGSTKATGEGDQRAKREAEIDRLTREHIANEMNVPASMVSTATELYKRVYEEMSAKVPLDFASKEAEFGDSHNELQEHKKSDSKRLNSVFSANYSGDKDSDDNDSDYKDNANYSDDDWKTVPANASHKKKNRNQTKFNVKGMDVDKKLHWLDLPTDSDLEKYSTINGVCKCLVDVYKKRYQQVKDQLDELKSIVDDIDKYSNYSD